MSEKKSQFIEVETLTDSQLIPVFGSGVDRKISKPNLFKQIKDESFSPFIYPTIAILQSADLEVDVDNPTYCRCEETEYRLYKITNAAPGVDDITLTNGNTAEYQIEYRDTGFVTSVATAATGALAVFTDSTGHEIDKSVVPTNAGKAFIQATDGASISFPRKNADNTVTMRSASQYFDDIKQSATHGAAGVIKTADGTSTLAQTATDEAITPANLAALKASSAEVTAGTNTVKYVTPDTLQDRNRLFAAGSAASPSISFVADPDTGFYRKGADFVGLSTGGVDRIVVTAAGRVGVGAGSPVARLQVVNENEATCCIKSTSRWTGSTGSPYQNNDSTLFETFNTIQSNSHNQSWSVSAPNAYNDIPLGVTDTGFRIGVYGWAVTTPVTGYSHAGTLEQQFGVRGTAGYLNSGTPSTAIINNACGVRGETINDSTGATILNAVAGEFISSSTAGIVEINYAVRASAIGATDENWSFHGDAGEFYNQDKALFGSKYTEMASKVCARGVGNSIEFGFAGSGGYGSSIGALPSSGNPFISFCAEVDVSTDTFSTSGQLAFVIENNLGADSLIFSRITNTSGSGLTTSECYRIDQNGRVQFAGTPILPAFAPASASSTGQTGQICWDSDYIYVCIGTNQWRRAAISSW